MLRDRSSRRDAWTARLVWGVWAALTVAALGLILVLGADMPFWDDWGDLVPFYAGVEPLDVESLWHPHNEHRIPLARLLLIGMGHATDYDFRTGTVFSTVALSAASALLLRSARGVNGRLRLTDCALPLMLLHWGHFMTLLWSYQVHASLLALLASAMLAILFRHPDRPPLRTTAGFGACLLTLPLCQAGGVALAPVLALWCIVVGVCDVRSPAANRRRRGWAALALAATAVALAAVAYVPPDHPTTADPVRMAWWSAVMLSTAFGLTERQSSTLALLLPVVTAGLILATGALLLRVARTQPRERLRAVGLGIFLLAFLGLATGIAWGRQAGALSNRYPVLAAPMLCAIYLCWRRYPGRAGTRVCVALCAVLLLLMPWNTAVALRFARLQAERAAAFERDVRAGLSFQELAARHSSSLHPSTRIFRRGLRQMQEAEIGAFRPSEGESR